MATTATTPAVKPAESTDLFAGLLDTVEDVAPKLGARETLTAWEGPIPDAIVKLMSMIVETGPKKVPVTSLEQRDAYHSALLAATPADKSLIVRNEFDGGQKFENPDDAPGKITAIRVSLGRKRGPSAKSVTEPATVQDNKPSAEPTKAPADKSGNTNNTATAHKDVVKK